MHTSLAFRFEAYSKHKFCERATARRQHWEHARTNLGVRSRTGVMWGKRSLHVWTNETRTKSNEREQMKREQSRGQIKREHENMDHRMPNQRIWLVEIN